MSSAAGLEPATDDARAAARYRQQLGSHIPALDGLRGLAILIVMLHHVAMSQGVANVEAVVGRSRISDLITRLLYDGWCGVDLFFVLSGFLITGILLDAKGTPHYLRNFYARRVFRIFPLYYGVLAVVLVAAGFMHAPWQEGYRQARTHQGWFWLYGVNLFYTLQGDWIVKPLSHFWSLAVEEHYYMIWPAVVLLCRRRTLAWLCGAAIVGAIAARTGLVAWGKYGLGAYALTPCRVDALAIGALLAILARGEGGVLRLIRPARWVAGICGLLIVGLFAVYHGRVEPSAPAFLSVGFTLLAVFFASVLLLGVAPTPGNPLRRVLSNSVLRSLGKYSYGLYVIHYVIQPFIDQYVRLAPLAQRHHSYLLGVALYGVALIGISYALAFASWHLYEKHFLKLKRYFEYRPDRSADPQSSG